MGKQLPLLERIPQTTDPWEDINLFKYIKSGYHVKILSARKMRRIEFLAKRYVFSENTLFYRCKFEIGDEPILKPIPTKESREELVKRTHNLGHFSFEKTYGLIKGKYYWPLMSRDVKFVINNCSSCLKYEEFRPKKYSVTEFEKTLTTEDNIIKIISNRGQEKSIEFISKSNHPAQNNTNKLLEVNKSNLNTRMTTRQTGKIIIVALVILIMLIFLFLPLFSLGGSFGNFKFCSISGNSIILNNEHDCQLIDTNPIYKSKNFIILEKRQHFSNKSDNLERFVTLIETVKWNPLTWEFFTDLNHILRVGLINCFGLFVTLIIGVLIYFTVKLAIYLYVKYRVYMVNKKLNSPEREMELPFIQTRVIPNIHPIIMPLNLNETPVYASPVRRRSSAEFNALINNFENLKRKSIFNSQRFKQSILESA